MDDVIADSIEKSAEVISLLHDNIMEIVFTKKDGSSRIMLCTLKDDLLPPKVIVEGQESRQKKKSQETQTVYDLEAKAFRSFNKSSLINYKVISNELFNLRNSTTV